MKKVMAVMLLTILVLTSAVSAFADTKKEDGKSLTTAEVENIMEIPVYISTLADAADETAKEKCQQAIADDVELQKDCLLTRNARTVRGIKGNFEVKKLALKESEALIQNELFSGTFERVCDLMNEGITVNYINFFVSESNAAKAAPIGIYLGSYNGYKFRYLESSAGIESSWVTPNKSTSISWPTLMAKTLKSFIGLSKNKVLTTAVVGSDIISNVVDAKPLKVSYGTSGSYLKIKVSGDLYMRDIYIEDKLNKVSGYDYYKWGRTEQTKLVVKHDAKIPTKKRTESTYDFTHDTWPSRKYTTSTPGFAGNDTLYKNILNVYQNGVGYYTYDELLDPVKLTTQLLS